MLIDEAVALLQRAIPHGPGVWADLGAGTGTFTQALGQLLSPGSRIYAVDRDRKAVAALKRLVPKTRVDIVPVLADLTSAFSLPGEPRGGWDGLLLANALHFVPETEVVLTSLVRRVRVAGRVVVVEYDRRDASRWVPHPITPDRLLALAAAAGLSTPVITARRRSSFGGELYVAAADRVR
ncbi:MAG TPA: class I SAM-dependent methyltransferase [Gemmatimonadales bacterium]|nr:class I SAM-dependent methyltransferase [Gemmatimonadales bacterium]